MSFKTVSIIGMGLIGGSIGLELRHRKMAGHVIGCGRNLGNLRLAKRRGLADEVTRDTARAVRVSDLVIVCTPVTSMEALLKVIAENARPGTLVIDCGSTKSVVTAWAEKILPREIAFVGCHPMAGTERSGAAAALKDLFKKRLCLITPSRHSDKKTVEKVKKLWKKMGSRVEVLTPARHDNLVAAVSHLPQMVASALFSTVTGELSMDQIQNYAGGGLKDTTRIAASPAEMWRDIALTNSANLLNLLTRFEAEVAGLKKRIKKAAAVELKNYFSRVSEMRQRLS